MSTLINPSSPALRKSSLVTAKFLASISAAAGITSFWVKSIAVFAICRCSWERSSGVNTSCGSRSSVRKLPPLTRFAITCTSLVAISVSSSVQILEDSRGAHAASHAHRHDPVFRLPPFQLLQQAGGKLRPRAAQRMPERDRAPIHIHALQRQAQSFDHCKGLCGEGFVQLKQLDLIQAQTRQLERL